MDAIKRLVHVRLPNDQTGLLTLIESPRQEFEYEVNYNRLGDLECTIRYFESLGAANQYVDSHDIITEYIGAVLQDA